MHVDELRRGLHEAGRRDGIDLIDARAVVGARATRRRRQHRFVAGAAAVAIVLAVAAPAVILRQDPARKLHVAPRPAHGAGDGWAVIQKTTAGLGTGSSFSALVSNGNAVLLTGAFASGGKWHAAIWYSSDGIAWSRARVPATPAGSGINAIAANGDAAIAIGSNDNGASPFVWRSDDGGRSWTIAARGEGLFGPAAVQMGRPSPSELMHADGQWIAAGAGSDGYGAVWTSPDGAQWKQVLDAKPGNPATGVGSVNVVDNGDGRLLAYSGRAVWYSSDGSSWGPAALAAVPDPLYFTTVAAGGSLAFGEPGDPHGQPTPLLRIADARMKWFVDPTFLSQFPDAHVRNVDRVGDLWVATGSSGAPNHPDAWVSADGTTWRSMPPSLYGAPGGTLGLVGSVGDRIVLIGTAPELDRYYTVDSSITEQLALDAAQDASDRYACTFGINEADFGADGLPNVTTPLPDRATAEAALQANRTQLLADYPQAASVSVGPGFHRAWKGTVGGPYDIVYVPDYALLVHVRSASQCPNGKGFGQVDGVSVFFTVG